MPQPRPSRERVGREYANLDEVLKDAGATTVDEWYPEKRLDTLIAKSDAQAAAAALSAGQPPPRTGKLLLEFTSNHNWLNILARGAGSNPVRAILDKLFSIFSKRHLLHPRLMPPNSLSLSRNWRGFKSRPGRAI